MRPCVVQLAFKNALLTGFILRQLAVGLVQHGM